MAVPSRCYKKEHILSENNPPEERKREYMFTHKDSGFQIAEETI
jgi:hypothetical protein